jgi:hypothetical protein
VRVGVSVGVRVGVQVGVGVGVLVSVGISVPVGDRVKLGVGVRVADGVILGVAVAGGGRGVGVGLDKSKVAATLSATIPMAEAVRMPTGTSGVLEAAGPPGAACLEGGRTGGGPRRISRLWRVTDAPIGSPSVSRSPSAWINDVRATADSPRQRARVPS